MEAVEVYTEYMKAHVRLHAKANPRDWLAAEIVSSFFLLPKPTVSLEEWMLLTGVTKTEEAPAPLPRSGPEPVDPDVLPPEVALKDLVDSGIVKIEKK